MEEWIRRLAHETSRQIRAREFSFEQAEAYLTETYPDLSPQHTNRIAEGAQSIYLEHLRRREAGPNDPAIDPTFRDEGWERPDAIPATIEFSGPNNATRYRTVYVPVHGGSTMADVQGYIDDYVQAREDEYPGWSRSGLVF